MKKYILYVLGLLLFTVQSIHAQESFSAYNERVKKYVEQYYPLAIAEQRTNGIPASVTLGQGILETDGGSSDLMALANNHFGIKCTSNWTGETIAHDDETDNECFKKYKCAADSYRDHSDHLKTNPRYRPLFTISPTDYASWAVCLKKCGYATNPLYAQRLIKIIEDFKLQEYTYSALDTASNYPVTQAVIKKAYPAGDAMRADDKTSTAVGMSPLPNPVDSLPDKIVRSAPARITSAPPDTTIAMNAVRSVDSSKIVDVNGMKAFYVYKDEMLLPYAIKYHIRYARLLEMNDLQDGPAPFNMFIYLEKKLTYGIHETHKVEAGENLVMISQLEGVQLKKIMTLNQLNPNEEPVPGSILELQKPAVQKPDVKIMETIAHKDNAIQSGTASDPIPPGDYIVINKSKSVGEVKRNQEDSAAEAANAAEPVEKPLVSAKPGKTKKPTRQEIWEIEQKAHNDSLAALKAELDKEVYVDNSKLAQKAKNQPKYTLDEEGNKKGTQTEYVTIQKGETLSGIAARNHITVRQLLKWNNVEPDKIKFGQKLRVTDPGKDSEPESVQNDKRDEPAPAERNSAAKDGFYEIQKGETLSAIARKNNITVKQLLAWNNIEPDKIQSGQKLRVTAPDRETSTETIAAPTKEKSEPVSQHDDYYVIQKGEIVTTVAHKNHITVKQLLAWNDIEPDKIRSGQKVRVTDPGKGGRSAAAKTESPKAKKGKADKYYVIQKGETLSAIARKNNISVKQLLEWNSDVDADKIRDGQKLRVTE